MTKEKEKQYIYIVQASNEINTCKIGKTNDLERRLKEYIILQVYLIIQNFGIYLSVK